MAALLSSPDPLNDSPTYHQSPAKPRRASKSRHSFPLEGSSPTKQTFELDVGNQLSPQKIRVTVEAGDPDTENAYTHLVDTRRTSASPVRRPINRRRERTTTTTVPVKGLSDSEAEVVATPKRGRGRPRKSAGTPVPVKKRGRASTPTQKAKGKRKSIGSLVDGDDEEDSNFHLGNGVEISRGKGRSRSRSTKGTSRKSIPVPHIGELSDKIVSSATSRRGRRKTLMPEEVVVLEDGTSQNMVDDKTLGNTERSRALLSTGNNAANSPTAYSTIRSTTSDGYGEPDITIARFYSENETPKTTGWSSPRVVRPPQHSSSIRQSSRYPSPSLSPEKAPRSQYGEDCVAMISGSTERQEEGIAGREEQPLVEDEERDEVGELQEFDTILESEGFSMISVDSVPSLREHMSSPANQFHETELDKPIRNRTIATVQNAEVASREDSFSSIPEEILEAATPGRKVPNRKLLSVQNSRIDESFLSIPPEILQATTPTGKTQVSKLLATSNSRLEDSFSSIAPEILEAATPGRDLRQTGPRQPNLRDGDFTNDVSFSAIPPYISNVATPPIRPSTLSKEGTASERLSHPRRSQNMSSVPQNGQSSTLARLPTPEETPSPPGEETTHQSAGPIKKLRADASVGISNEKAASNESSIFSQMRSSPPSIAPRRYTYTAHLRHQQDLFPDATQTPSIVFSSPSLPPPIQFSKGYPFFTSQPEHKPEPKLSPTVRAGRVLQNILVPNSPRGRAQSLGSPFKSPIAERKPSSSAIKDTNPSPIQARRLIPLPRLDLAGELFSSNSRQGKWSKSLHDDDPFSNNVLSYQRSPSPEEKQSYSLGLPENRRASDPHLLGIRLEEGSIRSDDAMSWQAEDEGPVTDRATSLVNHINSSPNARSSLIGGEVSYPNVGEPTDPSEQKWAAERRAVTKQIESASTSQVIVIDSDDEASTSHVHDEDRDFGLLLETLNSSSPAIEQRQEYPKPLNSEKPRRSKIPSPWRKNSKRLVYNDELSHLSSPPSEAFGKEFSKDGTGNDEDNDIDLSEFPIPQKTHFNPRVRERGSFDISTLLASSPDKVQLPVLTKSSQSKSASPTGSGFIVTSTVRRIEEGSSELPFQILNPIPQKVGFKPRVRDRNMENSFLSSSPVKQRVIPVTTSIFGSSKGTVFQPTTPEIASSSSELKPLGLSSPSKTNALPMPTQKTHLAHFSPSVDGYDSNSSSLLSHEEKENQIIGDRTLKWTETVTLDATETPGYVSPTKSCLRSPLKTPSAGSGSGLSASPTKNVTFVSSSPIPSSPPTAPLSATLWSRDHWTLLDSILRSWKPEHQKAGEEARRRNSTRVISNLLGKNVNCNGEKMKLQQWHLEVVDEFRGHVNGWQEADVAKRVFALLIGEEKRTLRKLRRSRSREREELC